MQNQEIVKIIDNLKGRRNNEEKKALKLGFSSLYEYIEDKVMKEKKTLEAIKIEQETLPKKLNTQNKSCGCC